MGLWYPSCLLGFQGYSYLFSLQTHRYFPVMVHFNERNQVNVEEIKPALPMVFKERRAGGPAGIQVEG